MKIAILITTIALLVSLASSCRKGTPSCIQKEIERIKSKPVTNPPGSVWQYVYKGQIVYFIPQVCCDIPSMLLDKECNRICSPDGGISGKGDGKCPDFSSKRGREKLIWKDPRQ
jgi:hypothetical protein